MSFVYILVAILVLLLMITIHEAGHYISGKLLGFKINEFSIGFGPALFSKKAKSGETFNLRALPLGGFCAFYGDQTDESNDATVNEECSMDEKDTCDSALTFDEQAPWKRIIVLLSGATLNLLSAFLFSFVFILVVGYSLPVVSEIYYSPFSDEPYAVGLEVGDEIMAVDGVEIGVLDSLNELTNNVKLGQSVTLTVRRNGELQDVKITKQKVNVKQDDGGFVTQNLFGFKSVYRKASLSVGQSALYSFPYTMKMSGLILSSFGALFTGEVPLSDVAGPVGTVATMADYASVDWRYLLIFLPLLASNLAIFNVLPIPSLDGARIVFVLIECIRRKPIDKKIEGYVHGIGLTILLCLVAFLDILGIIARL